MKNEILARKLRVLDNIRIMMERSRLPSDWMKICFEQTVEEIKKQSWPKDRISEIRSRMKRR